MASNLFSSNSLSYYNLAIGASVKSRLTAKAVLEVFISNSTGKTTLFP
jgi:hypothetical protein